MMSYLFVTPVSLSKFVSFVSWLEIRLLQIGMVL